MNTRLKQFLAAENITQAHFADTLNVVRASVSHVLSGRNNPSFDFIKAIMLNYPRLNIEWLMFGKGKMYKETATEEAPAAAVTDDQLFPGAEIADSSRISDPLHEIEAEANIPSTTVIDTLYNLSQTPAKQRKVKKILILFDDGSYQEM